MKALVVARGDALKNLLAYHLKPLGFEILYYSDPVQLLEELESVEPEMILVSAVDFPRHWKTLVKVLREKRSKEECVFVLLAGGLPLEEAAKAAHLGVNGIVGTDLTDKQQVRQLTQLYRRYRSVKDQRRFHRLVLTGKERAQLIFVHPRSSAIVTGTLVEISIQGAGFRPADSESTADLRRGEQIPLAALRIGEDVVSPGLPGFAKPRRAGTAVHLLRVRRASQAVPLHPQPGRPRPPGGDRPASARGLKSSSAGDRPARRPLSAARRTSAPLCASAPFCAPTPHRAGKPLPGVGRQAAVAAAGRVRLAGPVSPAG